MDCPDCATTYHRACWIKNPVCVDYNCTYHTKTGADEAKYLKSNPTYRKEGGIFADISKKIKFIAAMYLLFSILIGIVLGFITMAETAFWAGVLTILSIILSGFVLSFFIYGFGKIIEHHIRQTYYAQRSMELQLEMLEELKKQNKGE